MDEIEKDETEEDEVEEDRECDALVCIADNIEHAVNLFDWIGCGCERWFHLFCVVISVVEDSFVCNFCQED